MDVYLSEKEQVEQLKDLWNKYGKPLVIGVALAAIITFSWHYWQRKNTQFSQQASMAYQQVINSILSDDKKAVEQFGQQVIKKYAKTPYAALTALLLARHDVYENKLPRALTQLQWVVDNAKQPSLREVARIRSARILLQQKKAEEALAMVSKVDDKNYISLIDEVKGDIYRSQGDYDKAREAYKVALAKLPMNDLEHPVLRMKLDDLAIVTSSGKNLIAKGKKKK